MRFVSFENPSLLRELLSYDRQTGVLTWLNRNESYFTTKKAHAVWNGKYSGKQAFTFRDRNGYFKGQIFGRLYFAHRVIWGIEYGEWPDSEIDHINGCPDDNRIENLRSVSREENVKNRSMNVSNRSGHIGVYWCKELKLWRARIGTGPGSHLGHFRLKEDAIQARKIAQAERGYHENHGREATAIRKKVHAIQKAAQ